MTDAPATTPDPDAAARPYRPAVRGLVFGLVALGLRAASIGIVLLVVLVQEGRQTFDPAPAIVLLPILNLIASIVALVGVGYAAIAAHRREWGATLVLAWLFSVAAALFDIVPYGYMAF